MKFYTLDLLKHLLTSRINATLQMSNTLAVSQSVSQSYVGTHSKCELQTFVVFFYFIYCLITNQTSSCAINATQSNIKCSKVVFGRIVIVGLISFWFYKRNTKRNKKKNCLTPRQYISLWLRNGSTCRNIFT